MKKYTYLLLIILTFFNHRSFAQSINNWQVKKESEVSKTRLKNDKKTLPSKYKILSEQEALTLEEFTVANSIVNKIVDCYHLKPQNCEVDLFRSKDYIDHKLAPTHLGWKKAASTGVTLHKIPGDNFDMRVSPHDKILARMLQDILNKKHANI